MINFPCALTQSDPYSSIYPYGKLLATPQSLWQGPFDAFELHRINRIPFISSNYEEITLWNEQKVICS